MKKQALTLLFLALGSPVLRAQSSSAPTKVGIINIQGAIISTKDGQKAAGELQARFDPKRKELEKKNGEIESLRQALQKGANTMREEEKQKLMRDVDTKTRQLNRETEDAQSEFDQEQQKVLQEIGQKMMAVIDKYARDNSYAVILDVSNPQTPVLYASNTIDITQDIVKLYDQHAPSQSAAPASGASVPAGKPAPTPAVPAAKPPAPAPAKKQPAPPK